MENIPRVLQDAPAHIGIIMDGNGRWAKQRGLVRTQGHLEGLKAAKRITQAASDLGIKYLTLYTFSTENWKRTAEEVSFIMGLIRQYLRSELDFSRRNKIRVRLAGDINGLPEEVQKDLNQTVSDTKEFKGMQVILAVNYGGRDEIVRAMRRFAYDKCASGGCSTVCDTINNIREDDISAFLDNPDIPDPDLIIRSAGEYRTSNFLLWEGAYSELYISQKYWPDWEKEDLNTAIAEFKKRDRRYGGTASDAA
ncbi:MAG: di-trans,poly-cis-decaprenylcistransferase [Treponema sp.]|jgi:undecaprenyl diphosphate synthase|nr:di-trans,poly-cis-decaprenylcistransferase [Treponema sp.]